MTHGSAGYFDSARGLAKLLNEAGLKVIKPAAFESGTFDEVKASEIRRFGVRVLFVLAWEEDIRAIASAIPGTGWAWVQVDKVGLGAKPMQGWLTIVPFLPSDLAQEFAEQVSIYTKRPPFNFTVSQDSVDLTYSVALYEAVMLYAHAATNMMLDGGNLLDGEAVTAAVRTATFTGVSGTLVALDKNGDRLASYEVLNYIFGADGAEYRGMTFKSTRTRGLQLQEHKGGYMYCSKYSKVAFSNESTVDACKDKCGGCYFVTYYAGLETDFAKRCYVFQSAVECGGLTGYTDGSGRGWTVPVGLYDRLQQQYKVYQEAVIWPGNTMEVPVDYVSG